MHAEQLMAANPVRQRFDGMDAQRREKVLKGLAAAMVSRQQKAVAKQKAAAREAAAEGMRLSPIEAAGEGPPLKKRGRPWRGGSHED